VKPSRQEFCKLCHVDVTGPFGRKHGKIRKIHSAVTIRIARLVKGVRVRIHGIRERCWYYGGIEQSDHGSWLKSQLFSAAMNMIRISYAKELVMGKLLKVSFCLIVLIVPGSVRIGSAELLDDFSGAQSGSWAPVRWWDDYACRGRLIIPGDSAPKLDVAFSRGLRAKEITAAGGFVVEVDILEIRGSSAAICIGSNRFEERGIALLLQADRRTEKDILYVDGQAVEIDGDYRVGQRVRIEVDSKDFKKGTQGNISVYFDGVQVLSNHGFRWKKSPLGFHLAAQGGRAIFDNLAITPAQPVIEFARASSSGGEQQRNVPVDVVLDHAKPGRRYSVDLSVSSMGALGGGIDYTLAGEKLTFLPGETRKTVSLEITDDGIDEYDETVELTLVNPCGEDVRLGSKSRYSHTILGRWPVVGFDRESVIAPEGGGDVKVPVKLSHACEDEVRVNYDVVPGTAEVGVDYLASAGTLVFDPGRTSKEIIVSIIDDAEAENSINETATVRLSAPEKCVLAQNCGATLEIVDDELGIAFDGCIWLPSSFSKHTRHKGKALLSISEEGYLEWVPLYGDLLLVKLAAMPVEKPGEVARFGWRYKGEGNATGSYVENICERYGSGDLRMSVLDSGGKPFGTDRVYGRGNEIFCGYKGYTARLSPHVPIDTRADKWAKRVDPFGDNCGSPVDWGGCWAFPKYFNGHGAPVGCFSPLIFSVERVNENVVQFSVELNVQRHTYVDDMTIPKGDPSKPMESLYGQGGFHVRQAHDVQPRKIDTLAIYFANQRPFDLITFAPLK